RVVERVEQDGPVPMYRRGSDTAAVQTGSCGCKNLAAQARICQLPDFPGVARKPDEGVSQLTWGHGALLGIEAPVHERAAQDLAIGDTSVASQHRHGCGGKSLRNGASVLRGRALPFQ